MESMNSEDIKITDKDMNKVYRISLAIFIIGCILVVILYFSFIGILSFKFNITRFLIRLLYIFLILIGPILMVIIGLYGIIIYKFKPEKLKTFLKKRKTPETHKKLMKIKSSTPLILCLIGGLVGVIIGFTTQSMFYYWGGRSFMGYYIAGVSLFPIAGVIIELKMNKRVGSIICLISGIILLIISMFFLTLFFILCIPFFLIIAGSAFNIYRTRKTGNYKIK